MSIKELANIFLNISDFKGKILWDKSKPDGATRKMLDSTYIFSKGWRPKKNIFKSIHELMNK